ncbi:phosphatase domain-containing putative toxin [Falsigemmobacter faecalis]|uniref:Protein phosphatase n=1 Tax=Falsigemmobacter faecalis TaxID=2488730 RepID=A0A3P3DGT0_9RHOB|nr:protein phosphatase [Falsigemmobacter faecalis]RRH73443.1 protein phosphatase [Falsigemmobacter faecalis]
MIWPAAALEVAGGRLSLSPLPAAEGLAGLASAGAGCLLSLTEPEEEARAGLADLGERAALAGLRHLRLEIRDFDVPQGDCGVLQQALAHLRGGGHLALHCMGGCGRSGMIALRLMRMAGEEGQVALARLRAVRPCAIETGAQMAWALAPLD